MGMHIQIVYAYVGSVANRQAKILGVAFKYENEQLVTYTVSIAIPLFDFDYKNHVDEIKEVVTATQAYNVNLATL